MLIDSLYYTVNVLSDNEYTVQCTAFMSNGEEWTSLPTLYSGNPMRYIEELELGAEDEVEIVDSREV